MRLVYNDLTLNIGDSVDCGLDIILVPVKDVQGEEGAMHMPGLPPSFPH